MNERTLPKAPPKPPTPPQCPECGALVHEPHLARCSTGLAHEQRIAAKLDEISSEITMATTMDDVVDTFVADLVSRHKSLSAAMVQIDNDVADLQKRKAKVAKALDMAKAALDEANVKWTEGKGQADTGGKST